MRSNRGRPEPNGTQPQQTYPNPSQPDQTHLNQVQVNTANQPDDRPDHTKCAYLPADTTKHQPNESRTASAKQTDQCNQSTNGCLPTSQGNRAIHPPPINKQTRPIPNKLTNQTNRRHLPAYQAKQPKQPIIWTQLSQAIIWTNGKYLSLLGSWGHLGPKMAPRGSKNSKSDLWAPFLGAKMEAKIEQSRSQEPCKR